MLRQCRVENWLANLSSMMDGIVMHVAMVSFTLGESVRDV